MRKSLLHNHSGSNNRARAKRGHVRYSSLQPQPGETSATMKFMQILLWRQGFRRSFLFYFTVVAFFFLCHLLIKKAINSVCPPLPPDMADLQGEPKSVAILIMATGHYLQLAVDLVDSSRHYFCQSSVECSNVTYFLFTDAKQSDIKLAKSNDDNNYHHVIVVYQPRLGWPDDSMKRFHTYLKKHVLIEKFDFIWALDADLRFVKFVNLSDVYGDLVAVLHPGYLQSWSWDLPFERAEPKSKAFVPALSGCRYFTGAIWGATSYQFINALRTLVWQLDSDALELGVNFTAVWHDESHLNRYFINNPPTRILTPSYYFPEADGYREKLQQFEAKILALDKNHSEMRDQQES